MHNEENPGIYWAKKELAKLHGELFTVQRDLKKQRMVSKLSIHDKRVLDLHKLMPPAIFGEQAILDPWEGIETASVIASTYCEVLILNKNQLNGFVGSLVSYTAVLVEFCKYLEAMQF